MALRLVPPALHGVISLTLKRQHILRTQEVRSESQMDSRITRGRGNTPLPTHTPGSSRQPPPKPTLGIGGMGVPVEQLKPSPDWKVHRSKRSRYRVLDRKSVV